MATQRQRLNLLRKILKKRSQDQHAWFIVHINGQQPSAKYYLQNVNDRDDIAVWGKNKDTALSFETQAGVEYFIAHRLKGRNDVLISKEV